MFYEGVDKDLSSSFQNSEIRKGLVDKVLMWLSHFHILTYNMSLCIQKPVLGNFENTFPNPYDTAQRSESKHVLEFTKVTTTKSVRNLALVVKVWYNKTEMNTLAHM